MTWRQWVGIFALLAGLVSFVIKGYLGFWSSAFSGLFAGVTVAILFGEVFEEYLPLWAGATLIFGIFGVFDESKAFDSKLINAYNKVVVQLVDLDNECNTIPPKVIEYTRLVCALQSNENLRNTVIEFEKTIKLSPTQGLISNLVSISLDNSLDKCANMFNEVNNVCPNQFERMPSESKAILLGQLD